MSNSDKVQLYIDGGARGNPGPAACAWIIKSPEGATLVSETHFLGRTTNNVAEYSALLKGLEAARRLGASELSIFSDSELLVKQLIGEYRVRDLDLKELFEGVQRELLGFDCWQIQHIGREENSEADRLVKLTLDGESDGDFEQLEHQPVPETEDVTDREPGPQGHRKVMVEVGGPPKSGQCPANLCKGQCFVFTNVVPAGLCANAMQALLPTVLALQSDRTNEKGPPLMIRCTKPDCGAVFNITVV